ncbi:MAG TPA: hypothetical protein PKH54_02055 [Myxococcota bacterium]|nr:hypothetical protein [Myxococcota bacterium]HOA12860.1 hypothetical protein [Myxococcota bacterium]HOC98698.1 hypothetical protein [Myxococcota bacterium]HOH76564.1 hypothetical protein [Myxococcota bacterium]HPV05252.1 hypothetical protein [Myxococcota bacterium]
MQDTDSMNLQARVWRAVEFSADPGALAMALDHFMPQCSFGVSDEVPTARISRAGDKMAIEFGRAFLARELSDDRDFLFVLMHEIYHNVLGHMCTSRGDRVSRIYHNLSNIAADMMVNRAVCNRFFPGGVPLLERMYGRESLPGALLVPPEFDLSRTPEAQENRKIMLTRFARGLKRLGASPRLAIRVWGIYRQAWFKDAPYEHVLERLLNLFGAIDPLALPPIILIGSHDGPFGGLGDILGMEGDEKGPAGQGGDIEEEMVEVDKTVSCLGVAAALRRALETNSNRWRMQDPVACPGVVCTPGRRDAAFLAMGSFPVFYSANKVEYEPEQLAHVYVDVSGSMVREIPHMFGVLAQSRELIADPIHEFSNVIEDVTMHEFSQGVCRTTGGTDFTVLLEHAIKNRFRQIVVFTDGYATSDQAVVERFKAAGRKLHLVFVDSCAHGRAECDLLPLATSVFVMS